MSRVDGKKIVAVVTAVTVAAVAVGEVWLPYIADRDKVRGLFEEDDVPEGARKEMEELIQSSTRIPSPPPQERKHEGATPGSMWRNFRKNN
jgi:hypothetical protein